MPKKQWGGRFQKEHDRLALLYSQSISFDWRLYPYDIAGSIAHARMLAECGIIKKTEANKIAKALREIGKKIADGAFTFEVDLEDIHTNIEAALMKKVGADIGGKLHTGRSRNDQVALDMRMYIRDEALTIVQLLHEFQKALIRLAEEDSEVIMPGFTHMQHAQPVLFAHHMLAYYEMLCRDEDRFIECFHSANVMPLGSAALAGTSFPIDRKMLAKELGFDSISQNSMDAVSDRDYLIEFLSACSILMMHISRLSEELVVWSTPEFGFVELDDSFTTGSSIMPQKKNPDIAELARGKTARVYGNLMTLLGLMKGLPLAYNSDMQEDKPCVFDSIDIVKSTLRVFARMMGSVTVYSDRMEEMCRTGFLNATDLADYLVKKGMPFRQAHEVVGKLVTHCLDQVLALEDVPLEKLRQFSPLFDDDVCDALRLDNIVNSRRLTGGTARSSVLHQIRRAKKDLGI
ncbi:MAG: argininosuccinate lyase [Candidatus Abyssobacteria bacterium SURF_17]|uniref:Argininosuccinate lyase n=1 Tax=Candidatus Abyssobacteria bacterium SURF_17 TaxID=2093361 RepID=A0A419F8X1_9BACT|nr:MAG: argininosuccinate lyase [Candidatus Abyssubacteria bacterium SURF_17]